MQPVAAACRLQCEPYVRHVATLGVGVGYRCSGVPRAHQVRRNRRGHARWSHTTNALPLPLKSAGINPLEPAAGGPVKLQIAGAKHIANVTSPLVEILGQQLGCKRAGARRCPPGRPCIRSLRLSVSCLNLTKGNPVFRSYTQTERPPNVRDPRFLPIGAGVVEASFAALGIALHASRIDWPSECRR